MTKTTDLSMTIIALHYAMSMIRNIYPCSVSNPDGENTDTEPTEEDYSVTANAHKVITILENHAKRLINTHAPRYGTIYLHRPDTLLLHTSLEQAQEHVARVPEKIIVEILLSKMSP